MTVHIHINDTDSDSGGYKKKGNQSRGGLIRIKTTPNPVLIDNTNLEGIPIKIFF